MLEKKQKKYFLFSLCRIYSWHAQSALNREPKDPLANILPLFFLCVFFSNAYYDAAYKNRSCTISTAKQILAKSWTWESNSFSPQRTCCTCWGNCKTVPPPQETDMKTRGVLEQGDMFSPRDLPANRPPQLGGRDCRRAYVVMWEQEQHFATRTVLVGG